MQSRQTIHATRPPMLQGIAAGAALWLWASTAFAHSASGVAGGLVSGLLHPVLGLDHLVAMVAVGLWGAQLGSPAPIHWPKNPATSPTARKVEIPETRKDIIPLSKKPKAICAYRAGIIGHSIVDQPTT